MQEITLERAQELVKKAADSASKSGLKISAAVVDVAGRLVAFARQDGALPASVELSAVKAQSALLFGIPTKDMAAASVLIPAFSKPVAFIGGGVPLQKDGKVVGALGISGGMPDQDHELALGVAKSF
ncbi:MAG TPA: heme-binding protein [Polyangiaceae bacterium]|jgi:uncharacterized protein GlcG (DUF336 family)|nr:heme-binding protein [Polyangiaceae bacterium]